MPKTSKTPQKRTRKINPNERRFVQNFLESGKIQQSVLRAYDLDKSKKQYAANYGQQILKRPQVKSYLALMMDKMGLSDEFMSDRLKRVIKAGTNNQALKRASPADALRGLELAHRLKDDFPVKRTETTTKQYKMELSKKSSAELVDLLKDKKRELDKWINLTDKG